MRYFLFIFLAVVLGGFWFYFNIQAPSSFNQDQSFVVNESDSVSLIANNLKSENLIKSKLVFNFFVKLTNSENSFIAGRHLIVSGSKPWQIIRQLKTTSNLNNEITITTLEGWRLSVIASYLEENKIVTAEDFKKSAEINNWRDNYDFLKDPAIKSLEGFLFPDTYRIFANSKSEDIIKRMLDNFNLKMNEDLRNDIIKSEKTLYEIIILASIIEHEAKFNEDRYLVSGVFYNRLKIGMALQSDATVNYATGKSTPRASFTDLKFDSPYNTYMYKGLPPGAISSPGLESIKASIYPRSHNYYYFLNDQVTGKAYYARTYDEHKDNIRKYLD